MSAKNPRLFWLMIIAAIAGPVVYVLGAQWSVFSEYSYGWAVPGLALFLAWQKGAELAPMTAPRHRSLAWAVFIFAGLMFLPVRILVEASPLWRLASYALTALAVVMLGAVIYLTQGGARGRQLIFSVAFLLVAVPWPSAVEQGIIQNLTRFNAALVVQVLDLFRVPALLHGNVIEISTGMVGIDRACSGIRSLQATWMMAWFFGEFYRLNWKWRGLLLLGGAGLAMSFNALRTLTLVLIAAHGGLPAMEQWHDPTGVVLLLGCFLSLWGLAVWLSGKRAPGVLPNEPKFKATVGSNLLPWAIGLCVWSLLVAGLTEAWFRSHEQRGEARREWRVRWPLENTTLQTNVIAEASLNILQCDRHSSARWVDAGDIGWQGFFLRWEPATSFYGRTKTALAKFHHPVDCLPAAGLAQQAELEPLVITLPDGLRLVFSQYVFTAGNHELHVFFAQTEDVMSSGAANPRLTSASRWEAAWHHSRHFGQSNFELAVTGVDSPEVARRLVAERVPEMIELMPSVSSH